MAAEADHHVQAPAPVALAPAPGPRPDGPTPEKKPATPGVADTDQHVANGPLRRVAHFFWRPKPKAQGKGSAPSTVNAKREALETIVFVVVLVLLLKTFAAEAFVIPTGSMATTLLGYNKQVTCPQCGFTVPVNCSEEVEKKRGGATINHCTCSNCFLEFDFDEGYGSGDRVLVAKFLSDLGLKPLRRGDVVVFKFPEEPQENHVPKNYIKRLIGLPDEVVGIIRGKIMLTTREKLLKKGVPFTREEWEKNPDRYKSMLEEINELPPRRRMMKNHPDIKALLEKGDQIWAIYRKAPDKILALGRPVYDNNHQPKDLADLKYAQRWGAESDQAPRNDYVAKRKAAAEDPFAWKVADDNGFKVAGRRDEETSWLRYRDVTRRTIDRDKDGEGKPELITDILSYNTGRPSQGAGLDRVTGQNWVGDLYLECQVKIDRAEGELILELSKGVDRFQARCQLSSGECSLLRNGKVLEGESTKLTSLKQPGTYQLRFANVDERLVVWVDKALPFGDGVKYETPKHYGPTKENDLEPASIGARGGARLSVHDLKLWRDTYYTTNPSGRAHDDDYWYEPSKWESEDGAEGLTMYVRPGHYLCLGDNSPASSDSRSWDKESNNSQLGGLVPEHLMLGRALMVYWPPYRAGRIR
jgi:signal peptidase I